MSIRTIINTNSYPIWRVDMILASRWLAEEKRYDFPLSHSSCLENWGLENWKKQVNGNSCDSNWFVDVANEAMNATATRL